jgi:hypothetical protein
MHRPCNRVYDHNNIWHTSKIYEPAHRLIFSILLLHRMLNYSNYFYIYCFALPQLQNCVLQISFMYLPKCIVKCIPCRRKQNLNIASCKTCYNYTVTTSTFSVQRLKFGLLFWNLSSALHSGVVHVCISIFNSKTALSLICRKSRLFLLPYYTHTVYLTLFETTLSFYTQTSKRSLPTTSL